MAEDYNNAWSALARAVGGTFDESHLDNLTTDQQLKAAEVAALLSIAQELSALNPQNTYSPGEKPDGNVAHDRRSGRQKLEDKLSELRTSNE